MTSLLLRIIKCLNKKSINKIIYLQIVTILIGLLNVLSAILIAPFIMLIAGENLKINNPFFQKVFNFVNIFETDYLLLYVSIMLVGFYLLTIILNLLLSYLNLKWVQDIIVYFQSNLFSYYVEKNWLYHSDTSSKDLVSKLHNDSRRLTNLVILPFITLFSNLIVSLIIIGAIFLVDFKVAVITVSIFTLFYSFFYFFFKKKLRYAGDTITKVYPLYYKSMLEGLTSIKDVILFNKKNFFKKSFSQNLNTLRHMDIIQAYLIQIPRSLVEIIFFVLLISSIFFLIEFYNFKFVEISAIFAFYGICALKVIPALQKIFNSFASINSNLSAFFNLETDLLNSKNNNLKNENAEEFNSSRIPFNNSIKFKNVSFAYPANRIAGVFNVNISIAKGSIIGIVGKTGSGKSTLLDILLGFISPDKGTIEVDGIKVDKSNIKLWQKNLSYVPQNFNIYEGTMKSNIAFGLEENLIDQQEINKSMLTAELEEFMNNQNISVGESGKKLSGGQKQRVGIARALYKKSELIVLDEATNALDTITEKNILTNLEKDQTIKTIIIISHRFETLKMCDKFYFIEKGKVEELKDFNALMSKYNK